MPIEDFRALNPAYNRPVMLAEHNPALHLPLDKVAVFNSNLETYTGRLSSWQVMHPKRGQSLAAIAKSYGITLDQLRQANNLGSRQTQAKVATLLIPAAPAAEDSGIRLASYDPETDKPALRQVRTAPPAARTTARLRSTPSVRTHTIRKGDTLYSLARRYNTSVDALRKLNNLKSSSLSTGQRLRVPGTDMQG
jgi:membrane-bound lytic murein transglycosylase D